MPERGGTFEHEAFYQEELEQITYRVKQSRVVPHRQPALAQNEKYTN